MAHRKLEKTSIHLPLVCLLILSIAPGCTSLLSPIEGIPVSHLPDELLGVRRSEFASVPVVMLSRPKEDAYRLDEGDILSVFIDGVLPYSSPNSAPTPPPVNLPDRDSGLQPSIGYPMPVQAGGMISLPLLPPFSVQGMTVDEARSVIQRKYLEGEFISPGKSHPVVSLMRRRTQAVTVIRSNSRTENGSDGTASGYSLELPEGSNDVLNALTLSGGLPGFNERNEVVIYKTSQIPVESRNELMARLLSSPCGGLNSNPCCMNAAGSLTTDPNCFSFDDQMLESQFVVRIPLRYPPGQIPTIRPSDVTLVTGDIVQVENRETEFFYTGGLLRGGQFPLPRDYDLDALGAIALAGQGLGSSNGGGGGRGGLIQGIGGASPTQLFIIRKLDCGRTYNIEVDLQIAMNNSSENILVLPGDTLILRYKPHEELVNFSIGTFFTFGIRELFRN
ncbi:MAG: polysaccharide biosynthesis/export family protein [Planctomycetales bacterium]|nr:polysaccharide biosynthesis/export family protein [Planctomycetales bacterium]